jgi:type-F conjugative transfer system pilin assembly thiol-disulfide isomerase TrbB
MKKTMGLLGALLLCNIGYANVALTQLNTLLSQKESQVASSPHIEKSPMLLELSKHYEFIFIYRANCPHCQAFAPILKDFAQHFSVRVHAYRLSEESLDGFDSSPLTPDLFQSFYTAGGYKPMVPALFLKNSDTLETYPVFFGEASHYQLSKRMNDLMTHIQERFHD